MAHFLTYVIGEDPDTQLAVYDKNLPVDAHRYFPPPRQIERMCAVHGVELARQLLPHTQDWYPGLTAGMDEAGRLYVVSDENPYAKWDWWIMGGRWHGYLLLRGSVVGKAGVIGTFNTEPMHGDRSADQCRIGDIDWAGMRVELALQAQDDWRDFLVDQQEYGDQATFWHGVVEGWSEEDFIAHRSHPAPFALVMDTDWFSRDDIGWWGVSLDADDPGEWERQFDKLIGSLPEETLITVADCHLGPT